MRSPVRPSAGSSGCGSRISAVLRVFFTERNAPTLLVIDSLDEAHGPSERLRQADTLPWRIVLTSRPSSWRHQLTINDISESHQVGELQPLRYSGDVEPFIRRWFAGQPERGDDLADQVDRIPTAGVARPVVDPDYTATASPAPCPARSSCARPPSSDHPLQHAPMLLPPD